MHNSVKLDNTYYMEKPRVYEAVCWDGGNVSDVIKFLGEGAHFSTDKFGINAVFRIPPTGAKWYDVAIGHYIVRPILGDQLCEILSRAEFHARFGKVEGQTVAL